MYYMYKYYNCNNTNYTYLKNIYIILLWILETNQTVKTPFYIFHTLHEHVQNSSPGKARVGTIK